MAMDPSKLHPPGYSYKLDRHTMHKHPMLHETSSSFPLAIDGYEKSYEGGGRKSFDSDDMFFGSGFGSGSVSSFGSPPFGSPPLQGRGVTGPYNLWQDANTEPVRAKSYSSPERPKLVLLPRSKSVRTSAKMERNSSIFGEARPREEVLAEREVSPKSVLSGHPDRWQEVHTTHRKRSIGRDHKNILPSGEENEEVTEVKNFYGKLAHFLSAEDLKDLKE